MIGIMVVLLTFLCVGVAVITQIVLPCANMAAKNYVIFAGHMRVRLRKWWVWL